MADPFSLLTGAAGLVDVAVRAAAGLRAAALELKRAPELILALRNETTDLGVVLDQVAQARLEVIRLGTEHSEFIVTLDRHIRNARAILILLETTLEDLQQAKHVAKRLKWMRWKKNAADLMSRLKGVREKLSEVLIAFNA